MKETDFGFNSLPTASLSSMGDRFGAEEAYNLYPVAAPYLTAVAPQANDGSQQLNYDSAVAGSGNLTNFSLQSMPFMPTEGSAAENEFDSYSKSQTVPSTVHGFGGHLAPSGGSILMHSAPSNLAQGPLSAQEEQLQQQHYQNYIRHLENKISHQSQVDGLFTGASNYISRSGYFDNTNSVGSTDTVSSTNQFYNYQNDNGRGSSSSYGAGNREIPANGVYPPTPYSNDPTQVASSGEYPNEHVYPADGGSLGKQKQLADSFASNSCDNQQSSKRSRTASALYNRGLHLQQGQGGFALENEYGHEENARAAVSRNRNAMMAASSKNLALLGTRDRSSFLNTFLTQVSKSPQLGQLNPYEPLQSEQMSNMSKQMLFASNKDYHLTSGSNPHYKNLADSPFSSVSSFNSVGHKTSPLYNYKNIETNEPFRRKWQYNIVRGGLGGPHNRPTLDKPNVKYLPLKLKVLNASASSINTTPWTPEEEEDGRRIIRVERIQHGASLEVRFKVVKSESIKPVGMSESEGIDWVEVSMIKFDSRSRDDSAGYFMTSVEFIEVIECLIGQKTMAHSERRKARGRIRLNLMRFWLKTPLPSRDSLKSGEHDSRVVELALKIRKYSVSKPPGFNKEVRIMPWEKLVAAMQHALEYYFAEMPIGEGCEE